MIVIPQRLFTDPRVSTLLRAGNVCILYKELTEAKAQIEGYISNHVIVLLLAGQQQIRTYEDTLIQVNAGEVLFIPRGMYYVSDFLPAEGSFKSLLFYFDDSLIHDFLASTKVSEISREAVPDHLKFGVVPALSYFAESLMSLYQNHDLNQKPFVNLKILELLHLLNSLVQAQAFANFLFRLTLPKKRNLKHFMEQNFDKPLKVEDYAYLTGRSVSSFRRDFKSFYDLTPQKWLKERRLEKALGILNERELSVTELAYEVGYENISYFIKEFRSKVGQSPKQYILSRYRNHLKD